MNMEFWGVEVKPGEPLRAVPEIGGYIHLSQAVLGESKKGSESVCLFVKINEKKLVLGHLSTDNIPQLAFDLVFDQEFELSHNSKNSVFFIGYSSLPDDDDDDDKDDSDETESSDDDVPVELANAANGIPKPVKANLESKPVQKSKAVQPVKDSDEDEDEDDESDSDDDGDDTDGSSSDEEDAAMKMSVDEDESEEDEDDSESEEETPKKAGKAGNKRANDSAIKTPVQSKKQKAAATPQKTDGKKSVHTATPHPAKAAAKTKANGPDSKQKTPKSGGKFACGSCEKPFGSEAALQSHTKAKHSAK